MATTDLAVNIGSVVEYNGSIYLMYNVTSTGRAKLLCVNGRKFSGTPMLEKLKVLKECDVHEYQGRYYIETKQGMLSSSTGEFMSEVYITEILSN